MSMVRALRTLNAMEAGTLNAAAFETLLSGSTARQDELRLLLSITSLRQRIIASANVSAALRGSTTAKALFDDMVINTFDRSALVSDLLVTPGGKMLLHANDTLLTQLATTPSLMAKARAQSKYAVISATATGASSVSLSGQMPGSAYILLGISANVGIIYQYNISTKRAGGSYLASTNLTPDSAAMDVDLAVALVAPYSFTSIGGNTFMSHFGVLRCDI
jgi:hypothetical protein